MKKSIFLLVIFCVTMSLAFAQNTYTQNLIDLASIDFPSQAIKADTMGQKIYKLLTPNGNYIVIIMNSDNDKKFDLSEGELDEFYRGTIKGTLKRSGGKLISKKEVTTGSLKGLEFEFTTAQNADVTDIRCQRIFYTDKGVFSLNFWTTSDNLKLVQERDNFFNSFKLTGEGNKLKQYTKKGDDIPFQIGYKIGSVIGYLIIPGLIIFIIYNNRKKKKRTNDIVKELSEK